MHVKQEHGVIEYVFPLQSLVNNCKQDGVDVEPLP